MYIFLSNIVLIADLFISLNDYLKCLCNKADQCERVGKSMLASRVAEKGVRIEALFLGKPREGESNVSKDWLKYPPPRALYLSLLEVLKASKPQPTKEDAQQAIDQMQHLFDYAENHLPEDYKQYEILKDYYILLSRL